MQGLTNLTSLSIANSMSHPKTGEVNHVTDLTPIANLTNLRRLNLANYNWGTYESAFPNYEPNLPGNRASNLAPLANLTNLTHLYLDNNGISDISVLANMTNLTGQLWLSDNNISNITPLAGLPLKGELLLFGNPVGSDSDLAIIASMTDLWGLMIGNKITDITPLTGLNKLNELFLVGCHNLDIDKTAAAIPHFPALADFGLTDDNIDNAKLSTIITNTDLNKLKILSFTYNKITDVTPILQNPSKLTHLQRLEVSTQYIRLPDKHDYNVHNPMSLGPATINDTITPHQIATEDTIKPSTPTAGKSFNATTGIMTWDKTMPGDHEYNFNYQATIATSPVTNFNFTYSGTIAQRVPGITVIFDTDGGTPQPDNQAHHQNEKVTPPIQVNKPNWHLDGWYNTTTGTKWDFDNDTVTADITLKAHWKAFVPMTLPIAGAIPLARLGGITILSSSAGALALFLLLPQRRRREHARQSYSFGRNTGEVALSEAGSSVDFPSHRNIE
ncbi:hypothetical protein KIMH_13910 [Bombiscardovia apis]|uniref:Uncharacterized protein n=1 Tax=Bombiscardovia apis TaxID=2932182 RepID=A0ABM8BEC8_9BIFI|nr:hypothetical protein KIMH_13910 [Bombiscardovia apis]